MYNLFQKLISIYYYQKARNLASKEKFLDALVSLNKMPKKEESFMYFLLAAFLYERLFQFENALIFYDKAKFLVIENQKLTENEKNYLYKYINYGYIYIYEHLNKFDDAKKMKQDNTKISYNLNEISNFIKNDFVITD